MAYPNGQIPLSALTPLSVGGHLLSVPAAAFEELRRRAALAGHVVTITSAADAYRTLTQQIAVFRARYAPQKTGGGRYGDVRWRKGVRYVRTTGAAAAVPGTSNHGRANTVDIRNLTTFTSDLYLWMVENAPALGWSNTEGRGVGEAWHWVHDGVTLVGSGTDTSTGLKPPPPITITPIPSPEEDDMTLTPGQATRLDEVHWMLSRLRDTDLPPIREQTDRLPTIHAQVDVIRAETINLRNGVMALLGRTATGAGAVDLDDADLQAVASAVADEQARRLTNGARP